MFDPDGFAVGTVRLAVADRCNSVLSDMFAYMGKGATLGDGVHAAELDGMALAAWDCCPRGRDRTAVVVGCETEPLVETMVAVLLVEATRDDATDAAGEGWWEAAPLVADLPGPRRQS